MEIVPHRGARIRFLTTSYCICDNVIRVLQTPLVDASLLTELLPGSHSCIGSEVPLAFNEPDTTYIIAISGFNLLSIDALYRRNIGP